MLSESAWWLAKRTLSVTEALRQSGEWTPSLVCGQRSSVPAKWHLSPET